MSDEQSSTHHRLIADGGQPLDPEDYELLSNAVRCVVCGDPIDMEHAGDELVVMETPNPDVEGFDETDVREAMARALRRDDSPESHTLAQAYEDGEEIVMHSRCHDDTEMPNLYTEVPDDVCPECGVGKMEVSDAIYAECDTCDYEAERDEVGL